jgi:hypothetical protein
METGAGSKSTWEARLYRWLSAPLLIAVVGATLINLVIPKITSKSENHRRALEVKTSMVREMSSTTSGALTTARLVGTDVFVKEGIRAQTRFNQGFQNWQAKRGEIAAELAAYFPKRIGDSWQHYGNIVERVYFLSGSGLENRPAVRDELRGMLRGRCGEGVNWETLLDNEGGARSRTFHDSYRAVNDCVLQMSHDLVGEVLEEQPSGF